MRTDDDLWARVERWIGRDPDPETVAEARLLLDVGDVDALRERFDSRLAFGTAGLRGPLGSGPNRMNRLVVRQTAAGLADHLLATVPDAAQRGVVIGFDARHNSDVFASDTARVFAARGIRALLFPHVVPTPVLAFATTHLGAAAGVQVTASHNPPADNGYKVYWGDGPQIVPPIDGEIAACIDSVANSAQEVSLSELRDGAINTVGSSVAAAYLAGVAGLDPRTSDVHARHALRVVYTAMHGVGGETLVKVLTDAGFDDLHVVEEQFAPDPDFPTVAFPNPEEPGALDLAFAKATLIGAHIILANDPDADRLAVAVPDPDTPNGWRQLRGDEVGWLLADHLLRTSEGTPNRRLVCTTIVSSSLLGAMARAHDVDYVETLTGFKWLARAALARPDHRHVLSYEEALGYCVGSLVPDKDGISAALAIADLAASSAANSETLLDRLHTIEQQFGRYNTEQWSLRFDGSDAAEQMIGLMQRLRAAIPTTVANVAVRSCVDLIESDPPADVVVLHLADEGRITVRPSGTEPKCKVYFETVSRPGHVSASIAMLRVAMAEVLGVDP